MSQTRDFPSCSKCECPEDCNQCTFNRRGIKITSLKGLERALQGGGTLDTIEYTQRVRPDLSKVADIPVGPIGLIEFLKAEITRSEEFDRKYRHSPEARRKISEAAKQQKGRQLSEEHRQKISEGMRRSKIPKRPEL